MQSRRNFLIGAASALVLPAAPAYARGTRKLVLHRPRTGESVSAEFRKDRIRQNVHDRLSWLLRDVRAGQWQEIDPALLVLAADLSERLEAENLLVLSGYRTPKTNAALRGASKRSFHMRGQAMDFRVPGSGTRQVAETAREVGAGGVGRYAVRGFVHIDTGPRRDWRK